LPSPIENGGVQVRHPPAAVPLLEPHRRAAPAHGSLPRRVRSAEPVQAVDEGDVAREPGFDLSRLVLDRSLQRLESRRQGLLDGLVSPVNERWNHVEDDGVVGEVLEHRADVLAPDGLRDRGQDLQDRLLRRVRVFRRLLAEPLPRNAGGRVSEEDLDATELAVLENEPFHVSEPRPVLELAFVEDEGLVGVLGGFRRLLDADRPDPFGARPASLEVRRPVDAIVVGAREGEVVREKRFDRLAVSGSKRRVVRADEIRDGGFFNRRRRHGLSLQHLRRSFTPLEGLLEN
jgi:hypothetical protein